ncbi:hypothetical protein [Oxalicibacterium solurbis]
MLHRNRGADLNERGKRTRFTKGGHYSAEKQGFTQCLSYRPHSFYMRRMTLLPFPSRLPSRIVRHPSIVSIPAFRMHIVAIAWIYVAFMMAITETSAVAAVMTFLLYGLLPVSILVYLTGGARRRRKRHLQALQENSRKDATEQEEMQQSPQQTETER